MNLPGKLLFSLVVLAGPAQPPAWAHATLDDAVPAKNAELAAAPKAVTLRFNENLEPAFSSIKLVDAAGNAVLTKKATVEATDPRTLHMPVEALTPGRYTVEWVGVGHDGHRRTGSYRFTVK